MIVAGFGFRAGATPDSLAQALAAARRAAGQGAPGSAPAPAPAAAATLAGKAEAAAFQRFAAAAGLRPLAVDPADARRQTPLTRSAAALAAHGLGSVAEAAALAAIGPGARLLAPRAVSVDGRATCALARKDAT